MIKIYTEDEKIIKEIVTIKNLSQRTEITYRQAIKNYTEYHQKSLTYLLQEADIEEEQKISWKKRKLRKRLITFRQHLYQKYMLSTAKLNFSKILSIYKFYEIELHPLPQISEKQKTSTVIHFNDLPTKDLIRESLKITTPVMRAFILFVSSSGVSTIDALNLQIKDLLKSVQTYTKTNNVYEMINTLKSRDDIVPTFELKRRKTGKPYYTFCTPEAFHEICIYLLKRKSLTYNDRLFKITQLHLMQLFREINNSLNLGVSETNNYVKYRSHILRKYHASTLYNNGLSLDIVNSLQGKTKNKTDQAYFMEDPEKLKQKYIKHMNCLTINPIIIN